MRVLQVVPQLPPALCGVGDFATVLGRRMQAELGVESNYVAVGHLVCNTAEAGDLIFTAARDMDAVLVHYSAYGYQKHGVPFSFVAALERLSQTGMRVVTMFHELSATGPMTSKAFWVGRFQRALITRLANASAAVRTNRAAYRSQLEELAPRHRGQVGAMPVFSNFGESAQIKPIADRNRKLVLFQPPAFEKGSLFWRTWMNLNEKLGPTETLVAGRAKTLPKEVTQLGIVSVEEAEQLLTDNMWALVDYYPGYLGKSGIFAAHAAHGIVVYSCRGLQAEDEGLRAGTHYLVDGMKDNDLQGMTERLHGWYQGHSQAVSARSFAEQLAGSLVAQISSE
ncbi:MAG: hypothetical protein JNJ83_13715 [Verrucomicrobiaceae bacterium]|nr:hypothetical protein [Verrucomicrobiaceae bacterium]